MPHISANFGISDGECFGLPCVVYSIASSTDELLRNNGAKYCINVVTNKILQLQ